MKYLDKLKSLKRLPHELSKLPKAPYDSFGSTEGEHFPENISPRPRPYLEADGGLVIPFSSDRLYWWWADGQSITDTMGEINGTVNMHAQEAEERIEVAWRAAESGVGGLGKNCHLPGTGH